MEIAISGYKSIGRVQMKLGRVTVLLGPPAAGKSNLLEAIALATYFDRFALYGDMEPLAKLVRTDDLRGLSTNYDVTKAVEISLDGGEWRRSLHMYFQRGLRIELNGFDVPVVPSSHSPHFLYNGVEYEIADKVKLLDILGEGVAVRFYGFERFRDNVVRATIAGAEAETPPDLLREDGKNFVVVAKRHLEVFRDVNAELKELSQIEVNLLDDGRVVAFDGYIVERPPDSLLRVLYYLIGLSSLASFAKLCGMEGRAIALLEEPEAHPFSHLLVKYVKQFSEVGYAVITTYSPILVSLLRDKMDVTLYYVYRGCTGFTEVAELDKGAMAEELVTAEDVLFMKPREVLRFKR
ncbi:MAG: AAA family ATPase [Pyrobaculum sp.]|jgi:predicted ATPase